MDVLQEDFIGIIKKVWFCSSVLLLIFENICRVTPPYIYNKDITHADEITLKVKNKWADSIQSPVCIVQMESGGNYLDGHSAHRDLVLLIN